jgi:hypothetical protein
MKDENHVSARDPIDRYCETPIQRDAYATVNGKKIDDNATQAKAPVSCLSKGRNSRLRHVQSH